LHHFFLRVGQKNTNNINYIKKKITIKNFKIIFQVKFNKISLILYPYDALTLSYLGYICLTEPILGYSFNILLCLVNLPILLNLDRYIKKYYLSL